MDVASSIEHSASNNASFISFYGLRAMFYFVTPAESSFERVEEVPDYVVAAFPHFFFLIILEMLILYLKGKELRLNDRVTSIGAGIYSEVLGLLGLKTIGLSLYVKVYNNYRIYELQWNSVWTWIFMALAYDFLYYWFHRLAHEVNILWNTHQTHHSSEDYALPTALRQSATQTYASAFIYLPAALLVPPSVYAVHRQLNLLYQFWIHTELVDNLGPLEYVLNTPSHHRVHHGRNPYCIDKNYAAVLIIWDRMFGTFQPELKEEKVVYGLVHPINTFDSNGVQIEKPVTVYNPVVSNWLNAYVFTHFLLAALIYNLAAYHHLTIPTAAVIMACFFILASLTSFGFLFDRRSFGYAVEFLRSAICTSIAFRYRTTISSCLKLDERIVLGVFCFFLTSTFVWPLLSFGRNRDKKKSA